MKFFLLIFFALVLTALADNGNQGRSGDNNDKNDNKDNKKNSHETAGSNHNNNNNKKGSHEGNNGRNGKWWSGGSKKGAPAPQKCLCKRWEQLAACITSTNNKNLDEWLKKHGISDTAAFHKCAKAQIDSASEPTNFTEAKAILAKVRR